MAKLTKKAEIVNKLRELVSAEAAISGTKSAELAQTNISGEPCKDTKVTSVSESTEHTNKNDVGPDKLNNEQGYEQKPATDPSVPVASPKQAEEKTDVEKFAASILTQLESKIAESTKQAQLAQTNIVGKPGADTKITSVSDKTETVDKNDVGPEKLNKDQGYEQEKTKDKSAPVNHVKKSEEEEAIKIASWNLGAAVVGSIIKRAADIKYAQEKQAELDLIKEAGRRDVDTLIAQAAAELESQQNEEAVRVKQAEYNGALAFDELYKQAQLEAIVEENNALKAKLGEYYEIEKRAAAQRAQEERQQEFYKLANYVAESIKRDLANTPASK